MMKLVSMAEVAKELGVSRQRAHQLAQNGLLKSVRVLGRYGVRPDVLEAFKAKERPTGRPRLTVVIEPNGLTSHLRKFGGEKS